MKVSRTASNRSEGGYLPPYMATNLDAKASVASRFDFGETNPCCISAKTQRVARNARNTTFRGAHCRPPMSASAAGELGEAFEIAPFGDLRRPGREIVAL